MMQIDQVKNLDLSTLTINNNYLNPYSLYQELRINDPVHQQNDSSWVLSKYEDVKMAVKDPRFKREGLEKLFGVGKNISNSNKDHPPSMLRQDPPGHTRLRRTINKCFTKKAIAILQDIISKFVCTTLDEASIQSHFDIINQLAYPLPIMVICHLMGVPSSDQSSVNHWVRDLVRSFDVFDEVDKQKLIQSGLDARRALADYFIFLINKRKEELGNDIISTLIIANKNNEISIDEVVTMCILLFVSGHETTANLIGNGILTLSQEQEQFDLLQQNEALVPSAIEEFLRYESPVQRLVCLAKDDIQLRGKSIKKDSLIIALLGSANRDPDVFAEPDSVNINRKDNPHLAFSDGNHFCLGVYLARFEANIVFTILAERYQRININTDSVKWNKSITFRGLESMQVSFIS